MQNSELFRRGIVVPKSLTAEKYLIANNVSHSLDVNYLEVDEILFLFTAPEGVISILK